MVFINLVEIGAHSVHAGEGYAVELQQTVGGSFLGVALLVVEDQTDRPADGYTVVAVQARVAAYVHGSLELTHRRTVLGVHATTIDVVAGILEVSVESLRAKESHIRECCCGVRLSGSATGVVVALETIALRCVGNLRVADGESILNVTRESVVGIEVVVPAAESHEILTVDRTAEQLVGVVVGVGHLHVVDGCAGTDGAESQTVDFLILLEGVSCKLDTHILEHTRIVLRFVAAVLCARTALNLLGEHTIVVGSFTTEDYAAPVAGLTGSRCLLGCKDDRLLIGAAGNELAARLSDEGSLRFLVALDDGSRLDGQGGAVGYIDPSLEGVGAFLQCCVAGEDESLLAVANLSAVGVVAAVGVEEDTRR